jgi:hypothetical protein
MSTSLSIFGINRLIERPVITYVQLNQLNSTFKLDTTNTVEGQVSRSDEHYLFALFLHSYALWRANVLNKIY